MDETDFEINSTYSFEIGGKNKGNKQIKNSENAWTVKDDMEYPAGKSYPLWVFGFLY